MRLYLKLIALIAIAWSVHAYVLHDWRKSESLFLARCYFAELTHDTKLTEQLLTDAKYFLDQDNSRILQLYRSNATLPRK